MKEIIIGDDKTYAVVSSVGATVLRFIHQGEDLIFPDGIIDGKRRGGIPICFPFFGKPIEGFATIPQHGWLRHQELKLIEKSDSKVVLGGVNERTAQYPWLLEYEVTIAVNPLGVLILKLDTKRLDYGQNFSAPLNPGFHPYFCSDKSLGLGFPTCLATNGSQVLSNFKKESERIKAFNPIWIRSGKRVLRMDLQCDFNSNSELVLWSDDPSKYFCVEPVLTQIDAFAQTEGGKFLKAGESSTMVMNLVVMNLSLA